MAQSSSERSQKFRAKRCLQEREAQTNILENSLSSEELFAANKIIEMASKKKKKQADSDSKRSKAKKFAPGIGQAAVGLYLIPREVMGKQQLHDLHDMLLELLPLHQEVVGKLLTPFIEKEFPKVVTGRHLCRVLLHPLGACVATVSSSYTTREAHKANVAFENFRLRLRTHVQPVVSWVWKTYKNHIYVYCTTLLNEPDSPEQLLIHTEHNVPVAEEPLLPGDRPFSLIFPVNLSSFFKICEDGLDPHEAFVREIPLRWCAKFTDQIYHAQGANPYTEDAGQYCVQLKFARKKYHSGDDECLDLFH
jgi:hypothetical protein